MGRGTDRLAWFLRCAALSEALQQTAPVCSNQHCTYSRGFGAISAWTRKAAR